MARDWKPGDVAMLTYNGRENLCLFVPSPCRLCSAPADDDGHWHAAGGGMVFNAEFFNAESYNARPLVVIDPEDRERIKTLWKAMTLISGNPINALQAALRDLADPKPTKPEEPTGLGAVVVDRRGHHFVRHPVDGSGRPWCNTVGGVWAWDHIDAVEVLSQGVTP